MELVDNRCIPCLGGIQPFGIDCAPKLLAELDTGFANDSYRYLERQYGFGNFVEAMDFANRASRLPRRRINTSICTPPRLTVPRKSGLTIFKVPLRAIYSLPQRSITDTGVAVDGRSVGPNQ